jgi:nicotinamidase-related amidase
MTMKKILSILICLSISFSAYTQEKSEPIRPALVVIDVQNQFIPMVEEREKAFAFNYINGYIEVFRKYGFPIIRVYHTDKEWGPAEGTQGFEFPEEIAVRPEDPMVVKNYANAFNKTELEAILKDRGVNTLFLCGLSSVGCVLATWFGAKDLDINAFMLKDAMMSHNPAYTDQAEDMFDAIGYEAVKVMLDSAAY